MLVLKQSVLVQTACFVAQDTTVALHALSEYSIKTDEPGLDLRCVISTKSGNFRKELTFQDGNAMVQQQVQVRYVASSESISFRIVETVT